MQRVTIYDPAANGVSADRTLEVAVEARFAAPTAAIDWARAEYDAFGFRLRLLGPRLSSGPAWNMLLDLFMSEAAGGRLSVSALCIGARTSSATALRLLAILQNEGLVDRRLDITDARRSYVSLTTRGWSTMLEVYGNADTSPKQASAAID